MRRTSTAFQKHLRDTKYDENGEQNEAFEISRNDCKVDIGSRCRLGEGSVAGRENGVIEVLCFGFQDTTPSCSVSRMPRSGATLLDERAVLGDSPSLSVGVTPTRSRAKRAQLDLELARPDFRALHFPL
jgi:hypothetical protein